MPEAARGEHVLHDDHLLVLRVTEQQLEEYLVKVRPDQRPPVVLRLGDRGPARLHVCVQGLAGLDQAQPVVVGARGSGRHHLRLEGLLRHVLEDDVLRRPVPGEPAFRIPCPDLNDRHLYRVRHSRLLCPPPGAGTRKLPRGTGAPGQLLVGAARRARIGQAGRPGTLALSAASARAPCSSSGLASVDHTLSPAAREIDFALTALRVEFDSYVLRSWVKCFLKLISFKKLAKTPENEYFKSERAITPTAQRLPRTIPFPLCCPWWR